MKGILHQTPEYAANPQSIGSTTPVMAEAALSSVRKNMTGTTVENTLEPLEVRIERHGNIKTCLKSILPTYHEAG